MPFPTSVTDAVGEIRNTGSATNGCFYAASLAGGSSVDYTQQDTADLSLSDLAMDATGQTLTSVTGGFGDDHIGNAIYISAGGNWTEGYYLIQARTDTNTITIDRNATNGTAATAGVGSIGGAASTLFDVMIEDMAPGNKIWIGTNITLTEALSISNAGSFFYNINIEGYKVTHGDYPLLTDRPVITAGANNILLGDYINLLHCDVIGESSSVLDTASSSQSRFVNVKCRNNSVTPGRNAFNWNDSNLLNCEGISDLGTAFRCDDGPSNLFNCFAHDSADGFVSSASSDWMNLTNCIAAACTDTGVTTSYASLISNSVFDDCDIGIECRNVTTVGYVAIMNSSISNNTTYGIAAVSADLNPNPNIDCDYNNFYNNGTDTLRVAKGVHTSSGNPNYTNAATFNFTYTAGSACLNNGPDGSEIGLLGDANLNIGYSQNSVGGAGGTVSWISV